MSVRVNLLPRELEERKAARRVTRLSALSVVLVVAILGLLYVMKLNELAEAEEAREVVRAEVAQLEARVAELEQYARLADELEARNALLVEAMRDEVSFARVLNDLSLAFPSSSSLVSLNANLQEPTAPAGAGEPSLVNLDINGYSVERYAPGVETVLVEFDKVPIFFHSFVSTAGLEEIGDTDVTSFTGSVQLNEGSRTGRYDNGLPEGVPQ
jgi:hypothetical protein